jgi:ribosomal protein S18 acetylase RimI-like enzyme
MTDKITVRRATAEDADDLTRLRLEMQTELFAGDSRGASPEEIVEHNRRYFREHLPAGDFVAFVAEAEAAIVGTSGIVIYRAPPTQGNPTGIEGYVMNMYTVPAFRGKGIATRLLDRLVEHVRGLGGHRAWLRASDSGRPVYHRYGFRGDDPHYMLYPFAEGGPE